MSFCLRHREWVLRLAAVMMMVSASAGIDPAPDLMGSYCGSRSPKCCDKRSDSCTARILDTLCYCDAFCKNTTNDDCCPDYDEVCNGVLLTRPPGRTCKIDGEVYKAGERFRRNCNDCTCKDDGKVCCDLTVCVTDYHLTARIRSMDLGWLPATNSIFWGREYSDTLDKIAFTKRYNGKMFKYQEHAKTVASRNSKPSYLPRNFDPRFRRPGTISAIADQTWCNTAWAHSTVSIINDRLRIHTDGRNITLSVEDMIDCSHSRQKGCFGSGHLDRARNYLHKRGVRSTDDYKRDVAFQCSSSRRSSERYKSGPWYLIWGEANIQKEIRDFGPVQATMKVHRDFFSYKEGIYRKSGYDPDENRTGFLAVRIIGWGEEAGNRRTKYWIAANSWGTEWGEDGFFRIRRGHNECGIEEFVFAAWEPNLRPSKPSQSWPDTTDGTNEPQKLHIIAGVSGKRKIE